MTIGLQYQVPTIRAGERRWRLRKLVRSTTQRQAQERIVEQSVNVVVPRIMEGISAVEQITPYEHVQERIVEQSVYVAYRMVEFLCTAR